MTLFFQAKREVSSKDFYLYFQEPGGKGKWKGVEVPHAQLMILNLRKTKQLHITPITSKHATIMIFINILAKRGP